MRSRPRTAATLLALAGLTLVPVAGAHAAEPVPVTPGAPVVSDDACGVGEDTILLPETEGVVYSLTVDGDRAILPEGVELPGVIATFGSEDSLGTTWPTSATITLDISAEEGYVLAPGAPSTIDVTVDTTACAPVSHPPVTVESTQCEQVTITNPAGNPSATVVLLYLDDLDEPETSTSEEGLAPGTSQTLTLPGRDYEWFAVDSSVLTGWTTGEEPDVEGLMRSSAQPSPRMALAQQPVAEARAELPQALGGQVAEPDDYVLTEEDIDDLRELGVVIDNLMSGAYHLGTGQVDVAACEDEVAPPTPPVTPVTDPAGPTDTPRVPAVVQTDGGGLDRTPVGGLVLAGGLLLGTGLVVRRVVRA